MQSGKTALHKAAEDGHLATVQALLEKGGGADLAKILNNVSVVDVCCQKRTGGNRDA